MPRRQTSWGEKGELKLTDSHNSECGQKSLEPVRGGKQLIK